MAELLITAPTPAPARKVKVAAVVGFLVTAALAIGDASSTVDLPAWVTGAATLVATVGAAYLARSAAADVRGVVVDPGHVTGVITQADLEAAGGGLRDGGMVLPEVVEPARPAGPSTPAAGTAEPPDRP